METIGYLQILAQVEAYLTSMAQPIFRESPRASKLLQVKLTSWKETEKDWLRLQPEAKREVRTEVVQDNMAQVQEILATIQESQISQI